MDFTVRQQTLPLILENLRSELTLTELFPALPMAVQYQCHVTPSES